MKISVIVPVYNRADVLERCVKSILEQTWTDIEIILSDDGSTDESPELCRSLSERYKCIKVCYNSHRGASAARNAGMAAASGDFLCFLDSDDMIAPEMLERLYKDICNTGADIACCRFRIEGGSTDTFAPEYGETTLLTAKESLEKMLINEGSIGYGVSPGTKLIKRSILEEPEPLQFPENIVFGEDARWIVKLLERTSCVAMNSSVMMRYSFECDNSICRNTAPEQELLLTHWKLNYLKTHGYSERVINHMQKSETVQIMSVLLSGREEAMRYKYYRNADHIDTDDSKEPAQALVYHCEGHYTGLVTRMLTVLGWLDYAEKENRTLIVDMTDDAADSPDENLWNLYYAQPMARENYTHTEIEKMIADRSAVKLPQTTRYHFRFDPRYRNIMELIKPGIWFPTPDDYRKRPAVHAGYRRLYQKYIRFTDEVGEYLEKEYSSLLKGKGVILGVKCRGTDYVQQQPYNHPIQPSPSEVIDWIRKFSYKEQWDYIYLATEEKAIEDEFTAAFPGRVLVNQRQYYDGDYSDKVLSDAVAEREDMYHQDLEYLASVYLLSKCDMLAAGMCGGTEAAMIMKEGEYKVLHIFEKGCYGTGKN